jgi:YVTN family beta-propeller protein
LVLLVAPAQGQTVIATVPVGQTPGNLAVNPLTDKIYVSNIGSGDITVIDGATNSTTTIKDPSAQLMQTVALNPVTNKIYVAVWNGVTVIDGATNSITTVTDPNASGSHGVAVNAMTNKIYVLNWNSSNITVIDGVTNSTTTIRDPNAAQPHFVAVNPVTNKIYVPNWGSGNVTVIDGATNSTTTITDPNAATAASVAAVNSLTNKIYVTNYGSNNVTVIDGATNSFTTVTDPKAIHPGDVAVNPVTNKIYVVNGGTGPYAGSNNITVIDGATNSFTNVADPNANDPNWVAVDPQTNKIYIANWGSNNVTVIDGVTNSTKTVHDSNAVHPVMVAVNPATNRVYVANGGGYPYGGSNNVSVIAGADAGPVTLFPASLSFGSQLLHTASQPQTVTLTNTGSTTLNIASIVASANFYRTNHCPSSLAPGASCTIKVTFRPLSICPKTGTLTITDDAANSPQVVPLSGVGTVVTLSATSLDFGNQTVGTTSSPQMFTLANHSSVLDVPIYNVLVKGGNFLAFAQTNTCGTSVAPGASCTFSVTFTPHDKGPKTSTLYIWNGGGETPQRVTLTGNSQKPTINVSTGLDCSNNLITIGATNDCHWTVNGNPAQVVEPGNGDWPGGAWAADGPNSDWLAINANNVSNGPAPYSFELTFDLTGSNLSAVSLSGLWSIDDTGTLNLNGNQVAALDTGLWGSLHSFSVPIGSPFFVQGLNTLTITMTWTDNLYEAVRLEGKVAGVTAK